jgi:hypothetical protein
MCSWSYAELRISTRFTRIRIQHYKTELDPDLDTEALNAAFFKKMYEIMFDY